jgi:alkyl hydroperoxide reductase subunit F
LAKKLENHVKHYQSNDFIVKDFQEVKKLSKNDEGIFEVETLFGEKFLSRAVLVATGSKRRKLTVPGADKFEHKGLTYCASCDGPVFTGKDVVVIGGGNSGFEAASQLLAYTKSVTLLQRGPEFKAEPTMVENVLAHENMAGITNAEITEVFGNDFVEGIKYLDQNTGEEKTLNVSGVFVEIGAIPATDFIEENLVEKNKFGYIIVDQKTMETSQEGI